MAAKICSICGKRRVYTGTGPGVDPAPHGWDGCNYCYTEGGWENTHSDYGHETIKMQVANGEPEKWAKEELPNMASCWICHPELNLAQKPVRATTGPKVQGTRRPQLNHKGHSHPQTPAARRACKIAFWGQNTMNSYSSAQLAEAMHAWNFQCDALGVIPPKSTWAVVVPAGPKGGIVKQLKASKPKS